MDLELDYTELYQRAQVRLQKHVDWRNRSALPEYKELFNQKYDLEEQDGVYEKAAGPDICQT